MAASAAPTGDRSHRVGANHIFSAVAEMVPAIYRIALAIGVVLSLRSGMADNPVTPQGTLRQLHFSPDGRYVLAQNDSEITVLTVQPFAILLRIPADQTDAARLTPDSRDVVFVRGRTRQSLRQISLSKSAAHMERWNIADKTRVDSAALPMFFCGSEELSPDGNVLVCLDIEGTLRLIEVASGKTTFEQKKFAKETPGVPEEWRWAALSIRGHAYIDFSPDSHYVVVRSDFGSALVWDLRENRVPELRGELKNLERNANMLFAFLAPERVLTTGTWQVGKHGVWTGKVISFPTGTVLSKPKIPIGRFYQSSDPGFVLIRPFGHLAIFDPQANRSAVAELSTGQVIISDGALDVFGRYYVAERVIGKEVGLFEIGKGLQAAVVLHDK